MGQVIGLGAWCDFVTEDEYRRQLAAQGWPVDEVEEAVEHFGRGISFRVAEFALRADGRRLTLHDERGFTTSAHEAGRSAPLDPWPRLTLEQLEQDVRTTVLPDDAEESGEEHPWEWLCGLLRAHGVEASPDELRLLPYGVVFSERLRARVAGGG